MGQCPNIIIIIIIILPYFQYSIARSLSLWTCKLCTAFTAGLFTLHNVMQIPKYAQVVDRDTDIIMFVVIGPDPHT